MREAILDAAERRLREAGPGAIRLQDVAAEVGISHPAVLHHFGSREGLVTAVVDRAIRTLQEDLARALSTAPTGGDPGAAMFDQVFTVLFDKGHARLMAWLFLTGNDALASDEARAGWERIAELTHASRIATSKGEPAPSYEDTRFTIVLSALALFGNAIAGRATFDMAGFGRGAAVDRKFRAWLAELLASHLRGAP
jgi:AcrR family transcriptional regulator